MLGGLHKLLNMFTFYSQRQIAAAFRNHFTGVLFLLLVLFLYLLARTLASFDCSILVLILFIINFNNG